MTLNKLIKVVNGTSNINSEEVINKIKTDSRDIDKGDIFIALKGKNYDGHDYIDEAINNGATACIVEENIDDRCIKVESTKDSLFLIGNYIRKQNNIPVICITGSNGKTTTKELIVHILKSKYNVLYNKDNENNIIGVSNMLFNLNDKHDIAVVELGSNHIGEISLLSKMCNPTTSIITNIGSSHLEYFKNRKNIFEEKLSIKDGMKNNELIINGDDKYLKNLNYYKCGLNKNNDLIAYDIYEDLDYISFNIFINREYKIVFNNPGKHFINDILLAIKICLDHGIDINTIIERIGSYKLIDKRMNIVKLKNNILINDCYNSSFESLKAGINYMKKVTDNKIFIIGDMLELGKYSKFIHKKANKLLKNIKNKEVYTIGKYSKYIKGINFNNVDEFIEYIKNKRINNSYIYVKGSRRINLDKFVEYIKKEFI